MFPKDELVVAVEVCFVQLDSVKFLDQAYPGYFFEHHLQANTPVLWWYATLGDDS